MGKKTDPTCPDHALRTLDPFDIGGDRAGDLGEAPAIALADRLLAHRRAREAHRQAAEHAALAHDRNANAVDAGRPGRPRESKAVMANALEHSRQPRALAGADATQDGAPFILGTEG